MMKTKNALMNISITQRNSRCVNISKKETADMETNANYNILNQTIKLIMVEYMYSMMNAVYVWSRCWLMVNSLV